MTRLFVALRRLAAVDSPMEKRARFPGGTVPSDDAWPLPLQSVHPHPREGRDQGAGSGSPGQVAGSGSLETAGVRRALASFAQRRSAAGWTVRGPGAGAGLPQVGRAEVGVFWAAAPRPGPATATSLGPPGPPVLRLPLGSSLVVAKKRGRTLSRGPPRDLVGMSEEKVEGRRCDEECGPQTKVCAGREVPSSQISGNVRKTHLSLDVKAQILNVLDILSQTATTLHRPLQQIHGRYCNPKNLRPAAPEEPSRRGEGWGVGLGLGVRGTSLSLCYADSPAGDPVPTEVVEEVIRAGACDGPAT